MRLTMILASATAVLALTAGGTAIAQTAQAENTPWIEMETTSVSLGLGGQSGEGVLRLPNLGTNCAYAFKVDGFGAGIKVGVSHARATGPIAGMTRVADLSGDYGATEGNVTLLAGAGGISMKNRRNNVTMNLKSETTRDSRPGAARAEPRGCVGGAGIAPSEMGPAGQRLHLRLENQCLPPPPIESRTGASISEFQT